MNTKNKGLFRITSSTSLAASCRAFPSGSTSHVAPYVAFHYVGRLYEAQIPRRDVMNRDHIPANVRRSVLVEAGHRCAIPTCRATTTEIAHIIPWEKTKDNSEENLIVLCPNCHTRFDKKEMDRTAVRMYKKNLGIINQRYGELERRIFEEAAKSKKRLFIVGAGGDLLCANAVKDGLLSYQPGIKGLTIEVQMDGQPYGTFPMHFAYLVTDEGLQFVEKYHAGMDIG